MTENEGNLTGTTESDLNLSIYQAQFIDYQAISTFPEAWISLPMITH